MSAEEAQATPAPKFPGYGLPLNYDPRGDSQGNERVLFRTALDESVGDVYDKNGRMPMLTLREIAMLKFMNEVTDKQDWESKIFQDSITEKWRTEISEQTRNFTPKMIDFCLDELKHKAGIYNKAGYISLFNGDVVKSDVAIPKNLQDALKAEVVPLEDVPDHLKDWHPGSDETVLDLVHPSMFPLVYGLSRIITNPKLDLVTCLAMSGVGGIVPVPEEDEAGLDHHHRRTRVSATPFSRKFQWLPCDIDLSGETPKIVSYINNLHPKEHFPLYGILERIIDKVIPLWNATLTPLRKFNYIPRIRFRGPDYGEFEDYKSREGPKEDSSDDEDFYDRMWEWERLHKARFLVHPEPDTFTPAPPDESPVDLKSDHGQSGLQVIVKLANIHLTPDKPEYNGGAWHVEGKMNEHICASAIYYYDNHNITSSRLFFRQASEANSPEEYGYEQHDHVWLEEIFGLQNNRGAVQAVGSVETREGRVITFPNILQHRVQPFKLEDPSRPGHRKILALFLVDPNIRIISTAHVPCQQMDWWSEPLLGSDGPMSRLPPEVRNLVVDNVADFPLTLDKAKELREELMEERKNYDIVYDNHFSSVEISLCEH